MSKPGMALEAPMPGACPAPRRPGLRSMEGMGEPVPIRDPVSALDAGVGTIVVASPNNASISSNLTPAVSGYTKYTGRKSAGSSGVISSVRTNNKTQSAEERMYKI